MNFSPEFLLKCLALFFAAINIFTFLLFGTDKYRAKRGAWRISEKSLFISALLGGSMGALAAMRLFRHKTLHAKFRYGIPILLCVHFVFLTLLSVWLIYKAVIF